jgi:hypothetical protein
MKKNIDELVRKIIKESLEGKVDELEDKISMEEWDQEPTISAQPTDMVEEEDETDEEACKYHMEKFGPDDKQTKRFCGKSKMDEELIGGQKNLDKNKNGRLDKQDFKMLRGDVEEQRDEDDLDWGDKETAMSRMRRGKGDVEDIEFEDIPREKSDSFFDKMKNKLGLGEDEEEVEEGNAFTGALAKTKKGDKFNLGGKSYTDRSNLEEAEKFIQKAVKKMDKKGTEGSFKKYCGGEVTKSCIDKAMKSGDPKLVKQANFAKNIKAYHGAEHKKKNVKESLQLTESEMIDLIEKIVMEQKKAKGMAETEKVQNASKKENEAAMKAVSKKMKEYVKGGSEGEYETNPEQFPQSNGQMKRQNAMKYVPSDAVEEYIDAFAHPGQTNLRFDEIKPDDKKIDKYLKGDSTTGNAVKDKKGKALGNVVPSKVGEKFKKNYDDNLYGAEQSEASYKRQSQPVDVTGDSLQKGHLKTKKSSASKAQKVLDNVDESTSKKDILISEEFDKMKHLIGYNKKTQ